MAGFSSTRFQQRKIKRQHINLLRRLRSGGQQGEADKESAQYFDGIHFTRKSCNEGKVSERVQLARNDTEARTFGRAPTTTALYSDTRAASCIERRLRPSRHGPSAASSSLLRHNQRSRRANLSDGRPVRHTRALTNIERERSVWWRART